MQRDAQNLYFYKEILNNFSDKSVTTAAIW